MSDKPRTPYRKIGAYDNEIRVEVKPSITDGYVLEISVLDSIKERPVRSAELRLEGVNYLIEVLERLRVQMRRTAPQPRAHGWTEEK